MKVRIANPPPNLMEKYQESQRELYFKTAEWIAGILRSKLVQWFLEKIMKEQRIPKDHIKDIRVMRFPPKESLSRLEKQRVLYGVYSPEKCQISIYPFPLSIKPEEPVPQDLLVPEPERFKEEVIKTLIEEVLHAKYRLKYLNVREEPLTPKVKEKMNKIHKRTKKQADRYFREFKGWLRLAQESKRHATKR